MDGYSKSMVIPSAGDPLWIAVWRTARAFESFKRDDRTFPMVCGRVEVVWSYLVSGNFWRLAARDVRFVVGEMVKSGGCGVGLTALAEWAAQIRPVAARVRPPRSIWKRCYEYCTLDDSDTVHHHFRTPRSKTVRPQAPTTKRLWA